MCGIIGYVGGRDALPVLMSGLKALAYRGYDSAGVAICDAGELRVTKSAGKVTDLEARINGADIPGSYGIGHTRWATHGGPSDANAHPHTDCNGNFAVVHNGIFENSQELRMKLRSEGHVIRSQTDTELFAHLVEIHYKGNIEEAVRAALADVKGSFALCVVSKFDPQKMILAKLDVPPLIVGLGSGETFASSDISSLIHFTKRVVILEDGEMAILTPNEAAISNFRDAPVVGRRQPPRDRVKVVDWSPETAQKGEFPHFMLKEIFEQPKAIEDTLRDRLISNGTVVLEEFNLSPAVIRNARRIIFLGCGSAYHAGLVGRYLFEPVLGIPVQTEVASEFRYREPAVGKDDIVVAISQSGETADTVSAVREVQEKGAQVIAITNVVGSTISRIANYVLVTRAGPEIAVASTKAFTSQIVANHLLLLYLASYRPHNHEPMLQALAKGLLTLPAELSRMLEKNSNLKDLGQRVSKATDIYFIGRNLDEPVAREGSLKIKEISYIPSEAYAGGELKHGTLALLSPGTPVIALATQQHVYDKMRSNIEEVLSRDAWVTAVIPEGDQGICGMVQDKIIVPKTNGLIAPVPATIALQLLAYYCALARGENIDQPRNLAKSVTVE